MLQVRLPKAKRKA